jgi:hypothetical protein
MELLISIIVGAGIIEVYSWLPALCRWLVDSAVSRLPEEDQERCREEWNASLETMPSTLLRLVHAASYVLAAHRITTELWEEKIEELNEAALQISDMRSHFERQRARLSVGLQKLDSWPDEAKELARTVDGLVISIISVKDTVVRNQGTKIPAAVADDVIGPLVHICETLPVLNGQVTSKMLTQGEALIEKGRQITAVLLEGEALLRRHALVLDAVRARGLPAKEFCAAVERAFEDASRELEGWHQSMETLDLSVDVEFAWKEYDPLFASLRSVVATLRGCKVPIS